MSDTSPYIKIWKNKNIDYPIIEPAGIKRPFLDQTYNKIGYNCAPITLANQHGWWFLLPQDVVVEWDGKRNGIDGEDSSHIKIISGEYYQGLKIVTNESGVGQISFLFNCNIETDKDNYLIFSGPPNYFHDDAKSLEVIWRSDFYTYHEISFNWIITTPNKEVVFPKNMPVLFIKNYPKNLLNNTNLYFDYISNNQKLKDDTDTYAQERVEWFKEHDNYSFRKFYKAALGPNKKIMTEDAPLTIKLDKGSYTGNCEINK